MVAERVAPSLNLVFETDFATLGTKALPARSLLLGTRAVERWENEGGKVSAPPIFFAGNPLRTGERVLLTDRVARTNATFAADFADGRMGTRHNTFQHRARVLRQMRTRLAMFGRRLSTGGESNG